MQNIKDVPQAKTTSPLVFGKVVDIFSLFGLPKVPYSTKVSFLPLIRYWKDQINSEDQIKALIAQNIFSLLDDKHELYKPIENLKILEKYTDVLKLLTSIFFPIGNDKHLVRLTGPFNTMPFYHSPAVNKLLLTYSSSLVLDKNAKQVWKVIVTRAGCLILNKFYGQNLPLNPPYIFSATDSDSSLERHFQTSLDDRFIDIIKKKPLKKLTSVQINRLLANIDNVDMWLKYLPPENFDIQGVQSTSLTNITQSEALSRLKNSLLKSDAIVNKEKIADLELDLRTFFNQPKLRMGIFMLDYQKKQKHFNQHEINHGFLSEKHPKLLSSKFMGSIYEKTCRRRELTIIDDLEHYPNPTKIEKALLEEGLKSLLLSPIFNAQKQIIGMMELGCSEAYALNSFSSIKLSEIMPLMRIAFNRSQMEIDNQIEAIIRDQFTSLHPSVEWRFVKDAYRILHNKGKRISLNELKPIIFQDVYPLYGQADIVGSSKKRNTAVQADLIYNLYQIKKFLMLALKFTAFPLVEKLILEVDRQSAAVKRHVTSTNEYQIMTFIKKKVHPVLKFLQNKNDILKEAAKMYFKQLDPTLGIVYKKRKDYDLSVTMLNKAISDFMELEERKSQNIFPHYFEKYQTDGVSYNIYTGQSLLEKGKFKKLHLHNLRLWQLIKTCEITRIVNDLKQNIPLPLETAQLILVHSAPMTIEFRMDEKRFDVAGSYNVRYEIIKKRIDKALIEGTNERLTVSEKIAIVYQHEKDRTEYLEYLDFLIKKGLIYKDIEELDLQRMQGVQGLKALRIKVKL